LELNFDAASGEE